jgi:hypothetical protein
MLFVDCPLCGDAAPFDADGATLDCPGCDVRLDLTSDEPRTLAAAA